MGQLDGKTAVVTGAARGIGLAAARQLDAAGARVVVLDRDGSGAKDCARGLRDGRAVEADISDYGSVAEALADVSRIDVLVNNAGWDFVQPFVDNDPALWDKLIGINLRGLFNMCHIALPKMSAGGRIVNVASDSARVGSPGEAVYSATKGGVIAFTKSLALEVAGIPMSVNCVSPGLTDTPLHAESGFDVAPIVDVTPMRRMATSDEVAEAVLFFASGPEFVTGQILSVSGGITMAG
ncbi:SDR family NAD(P)-dependent oxidoreductase [Streptomyces sp. GbtcB7]|uniref:SDR family NAD(P)-dependent oxidoreductase n=1 Tax=Streptomyces sp. GbtcB7 TaxID=2824752 RepID=UPI001C300574|nr:SDR family NAD(P)-dependent oxidoreductase [Streptomyces sp. GbtcB7]